MVAVTHVCLIDSVALAAGDAPGDRGHPSRRRASSTSGSAARTGGFNISAKLDDSARMRSPFYLACDLPVSEANSLAALRGSLRPKCLPGP